MKEFDMYIKWIRRQYPDSMNKEQFYKIAHISKAKARWLLQTGLVPCLDTGRKTRRYTIRTDDVIAYLKDRAIKPLPRRGRLATGLPECKEQPDISIHAPAKGATGETQWQS